MKHYLVAATAAAMLGTGALAQIADPSHNPAIKSSAAVHVSAAAKVQVGLDYKGNVTTR